jgi:hypothetical protein
MDRQSGSNSPGRVVAVADLDGRADGTSARWETGVIRPIGSAGPPQRRFITGDRPRKDFRSAPAADLLLTQQDHWIERQGALGWNPGSRKAE